MRTSVAPALVAISMLTAPLLSGCAGRTPASVDTTAGSGGQGNAAAPRQITVRTFALPDFRGHTVAEVDQWVRSNQVRVHVAYNTEVGYNYSASCRVQKTGNVLRQSPFPRTVVKDSSSTAIWLSIDC